MENYQELLTASQENWEDFTTGKRRKPQGGPDGPIQNNKFSGDPKDIGAQQTLDANGKVIWKGSGTVVNYMPAWERKFQKSLQQKQARL